MSASSIKAGSAFVELFVKGIPKAMKDIEGIGKGLSSAGQTVAAAGGAITAAGLALGAPLAAAVQQFVGLGSQLDDISQRTGIGAEALSELKFAAEQSGTGIEAVEKGVRKMQQGLVDAAAGSKTATAAFGALGLSAEDLLGMSPDQQFAAIADRLAQIEDPAQRASAAMDIFGKAGAELLPMVADGAAGIDEMRAKARELGVTMSGEDAAAAGKLGDLFDTLKSQLLGVASAIGSALAPDLIALGQGLTKTVAWVIRWVKDNKPLIVTIAKVAAGVIAAGAAISAIGVALMGAGAVLSGIIAAFGFLATVAGLVGSIFAFLITPIGAVIAIVVGLAAYFAATTGVVGQSLQWLRDRFSEAAGFIGEVWGGIADALAAGDLGLAMEVAAAGLQVAWVGAMTYLKGKWLDFKGYFLQIWSDATTGLWMSLTNVWAGLQSAWQESVAFMATAWAIFANGAVSTWRSAQNAISKGIIELMGYFDDSLDTEGAKAILDQDFAREQRNRDRQTEQQILGIEQRRQNNQSGIEQTRQEQLAKLQADQTAADAARRAAADGERAAADQKFADAQAKLLALRGKAAAAKEAAARPELVADPLKKPDFGPAFAGGEKAKGEAVGTFSSDIAGLGASSIAERQLKVAERQLKAQEKNNQLIEEQALQVRGP